MADPKPEIFQSCGLAFKTPLIPKEYQSNSDIDARIFLRKPYPCGRQDESNKLDFVFEAPKLVDNHVLQESTLPSPTQTVILVQNDSTGEVCPMGPPEGFPQGGPIHVGNFGNIEWNDQVGSPVVQGSPFGNFENHVEEVQAQVTAAPQKLVTLQNVDQAMTTKYIIDFIANAESNVENNIEKFPSKNLDETSTDPNSRMAKIFAQTSNGSLVEFLANQQQEEENASKTNEANTGQLKSKKGLFLDNFKSTKTLYFVISKIAKDPFFGLGSNYNLFPRFRSFYIPTFRRQLSVKHSAIFTKFL